MTLRIMGQAHAAMNALQKKLDTIDHNLANSNTHGYKSRHVEFQSLLKQQVNYWNDPIYVVGRRTLERIGLVTRSKLVLMNSDLSICSLQVTDRSLDTVLLHESQLYQIHVQRDEIDEVMYTRSGDFYV